MARSIGMLIIADRPTGFQIPYLIVCRMQCTSSDLRPSTLQRKQGNQIKRSSCSVMLQNQA
eukprot:792971-Amphidinium_carterae.1